MHFFLFHQTEEEETMANVSFFSKLHNIFLGLFFTFIIDVILFIYSLSCYNWWPFHRHPTGATTSITLLALVNDENPTILYNDGGDGGGAKECAVCLTRLEDGDEIRELECKHDFHEECLDQWLKREKGTCPLCRRYVLPEELVLLCSNISHKQLRSDEDEFYRDALLFTRW